MVIALGDESGECAVETAATSKEGSRRAPCPVHTHREASVFLDTSSLGLVGWWVEEWLSWSWSWWWVVMSCGGGGVVCGAIKKLFV